MAIDIELAGEKYFDTAGLAAALGVSVESIEAAIAANDLRAKTVAGGTFVAATWVRQWLDMR